MSREVIHVTMDTRVEELASLLYENGISGVPVLDDNGQLLGVVTESDLIEQGKKLHIPTMIAFLDSVIFLESASRFEKDMKKMSGCTVADIYSGTARWVDEEADLETIATLMAEKKVHTLPVLRDGELVGVIGKRDLIKVMAGRLEGD